MFFWAPVDLGDWFWDGGVYAAWSDDPVVSDGPLRPDANSMDNASRLSQQWLGALRARQSHLAGAASVAAPLEAYAHTPCTFAHAPRPMLRSVLFALEELAPELFVRLRSTVFRTWDKPTIVSDFVIRWALAHGIARMRDYSHLYLSTGDADIGAQLDRLVSVAEGIDFLPQRHHRQRAGAGRQAGPGAKLGVRSCFHCLTTSSAGVDARLQDLTPFRVLYSCVPCVIVGTHISTGSPSGPKRARWPRVP